MKNSSNMMRFRKICFGVALLIFSVSQAWAQADSFEEIAKNLLTIPSGE